MKSKPQEIPPLISLSASVFGWACTIFATIFFNLIALFFIFPITYPFDRGRRRWLHGVAQGWARAIIFLTPYWKLEVHGSHHLRPGERYVIVANHQSLLDILAALAGISTHFKFMAKQELFSIPFLGWHMSLAGYIPLKRGDRESGRKAIFEAREWLQKGVSVLFFPEGTRSLDGKIHDFKPGAFRLAGQEKVKVLPVVIDGTAEALPKKNWRVKKRSKFCVWIDKPVDLGAGEDVIGDMEKIRAQMMDHLAKIRS